MNIAFPMSFRTNTSLAPSTFSEDLYQTIRSNNIPCPNEEELITKLHKAAANRRVFGEIAEITVDQTCWVRFTQTAEREVMNGLFRPILGKKTNSPRWVWSDRDCDDELGWIARSLLVDIGPEILTDIQKIKTVSPVLIEYLVSLFPDVDTDKLSWTPPVQENLQEYAESLHQAVKVSQEAADLLAIGRQVIDEADHHYRTREGYDDWSSGAYRLVMVSIFEEEVLVHLEGHQYAGPNAGYVPITLKIKGVENIVEVDDPSQYTGVYDRLQELFTGAGTYPVAKVEGMARRGLIDIHDDNAMSEAKQRESTTLFGGCAVPTTQDYQRQTVVIDPELAVAENHQMVEALGGIVGSFGAELELDAEERAGVIDHVLVFGLDTKHWLGVKISDLTPYAWDPAMFDRIIMDKERKALIKALVETPNLDNDDVESKGNNTSFLLAGDTGSGKTLTAEASAHLLQRPLVKMSFGELGVNAQWVEARMRTLMRYGNRWGGLMLLDEADIFLAERDNTHLERTALIATFLSLLEYFQGTLFLTTNRDTNIDPAIWSRITLGLTFRQSDLDHHALWHNLLTQAGVTTMAREDIQQLVKTTDLNGRQIKNRIATAIRIAQHQGTRVDVDTILSVDRLSVC